jgi:hypothetical protein
MAWATYEDVVARWIGSEIPAQHDEATVETLIADAEAIILSEYPALQDRIDDEAIAIELVVFVVCQMVIRTLRNPENLTYWQQQTGPFGQGKNFSSDSLGIYMTDKEVGLLAPRRKGKAFEVDLGWNTPAPQWAVDEIWTDTTR